jgi:ribosomal protein L32
VQKKALERPRTKKCPEFYSVAAVTAIIQVLLLGGRRESNMKCPQCGKETSPGNVCEKCGEAAQTHKVQVEYKEFKISELLDIRMARNAGPVRSGQKGKKTVPLSRKETRTIEVPGTEKNSRTKTSLIVIMTLIIVVITAIVGFYLFENLK